MDQQDTLYLLLTGQSKASLHLASFYSFIVRLPTAGAKLAPKIVDEATGSYKYERS